MKKLINISLIATFIFTLTSCAQSKTKDVDTDQAKPTVELISPTDLNTKLGDIQLVDVRTPKEHAEGHVKGSKNINFYDDDFITQISTLDKDKEIYVYCKSGGRSGKAAQKLKAAGFKKVYDLQGGFKNWSGSNLEVVK
ncbi:MAG TPA: rhodanese-like domain-containing protein [Flavobacteriaceae bacterium]|jgi:rhodanese-related sulfurtransferase|nr:rhodanese-like domain-containing protein [Flavobacteriaceae bacterium]HBS13167.1 rhodanese-like domain-containing protein [Flavobacteriaceae bacterium]